MVLGPHAVGAKDLLPGPLAPLGRILAAGSAGSGAAARAGAAIPLQFVHEDDLGQALLQCVVAAGPPGAYNVAADGILTTADVAREFGLIPLPLPAGPARPRPGPSPRCRSCRRPPSGSRRPATRRSWTPPRRSGTWAGLPASPRSRPCGTPCARAGPPLRTLASARAGYHAQSLPPV